MIVLENCHPRVLLSGIPLLNNWIRGIPLPARHGAQKPAGMTTLHDREWIFPFDISQYSFYSHSIVAGGLDDIS